MAAWVSCPKCGRAYSVPEGSLGQALWCSCGARIEGSGPSPVISPSLQPQTGQSGAADWAVRTAHRLRMVRLLLAAGIVLVIVGYGVFRFATGRPPPSPPEQTAPEPSQPTMPNMPPWASPPNMPSWPPGSSPPGPPGTPRQAMPTMPMPSGPPTPGGVPPWGTGPLMPGSGGPPRNREAKGKAPAGSAAPSPEQFPGMMGPESMPWPVGPGPMMGPGGTGPMVGPGAPPAEPTASTPLLPASQRGQVTSISQLDGKPPKVTVRFTWPREPTSEDKKRCWLVVTANDPNLQRAAEELQDLAGMLTMIPGAASLQSSSGKSSRIGCRPDWSASSGSSREYAVTVSFHSSTGRGGATPPLKGKTTIAAQLLDFGFVPPKPVSDVHVKPVTF